MDYAVKLLKFELADSIDSGVSKEDISDLRAAIMTLNRSLFHQKIMGSDPNNKYYVKP